ncbi:unnamed protein product [Rotaria magnacalcarata]
MIDKDLTNADILQHYFDKARTLLCAFHVLKYLEVQIHALKILLTNRMNIMKNIRKLLYDNDQMSAIYLKEIKINSEETDFYEYFEKNWLSCCETWQKKYRKNLFNFDTDTNNHLERFNRLLKDHISYNMHISECVIKLLVFIGDFKAEERNSNISLKQKIYNDDDSILLKKFGSQLTNKANELLRKQNDETKHKNYFIEEIEDNKWKVGQKDEEKNHSITSSIASRDSNNNLLFCDCQFYLQNHLPCRHMIVLLNKINDEIYERTCELQQIISLNKRWLKSPTKYYLNEANDYDDIPNYNSQFTVTQSTPKENKILNSNDKYSSIRPTLDILAARIIQSGTIEFNEHFNFLNYQVIEQEIFVNLSDDTQKQVTPKKNTRIIGIQEVNANSNHWLTKSNKNCGNNVNNAWKFYDSLSYPKELIIKFFKDILPDEEKVSVSFEHVQQQIGGNDCRLFALAFATSHCYKDVPSLMFYDQLSLRDHYVKCIENNEIQAFLSKSKRGSTRNASKLVDIYFELIFFCCCVIILVNLYLCAINN